MTKPQFESVSNFRNNYNAVLEKLSNGPLYLLQHSSPAAVVLDPKHWDAILERLSVVESLEDQVSAYRHKWLEASGQSKHDLMSPEDLEAWAADDEKVLA